MEDIKLGCHIWSFNNCTTLEAAKMIKALGISYMDLGNSPDIDPANILEHIDEEAQRLNKIREETGITFVDAFPQLKPGFTLNHPDKKQRLRNQQIFSGFMQLAARIDLEGITLSPGKYWPREDPDRSFKRGSEQLKWAVEEGSKHDLKIRIEPHIESITWRPELAVRMVEAVPGLSLTIDHSHFIFHGLPYEQIARLHAYGSHWHARQAKPGQAQCRYDQGQIDFSRIIKDLSHIGYCGYISLEYVYGDWMGMGNIDCITETVKLRDELQDLLK